MWEAIATNRRRSFLLIILLGMLLIATGLSLGLYYHPDPYYGAPFGALIAFVVWIFSVMTALFAGDSILLATVGAKRIEQADAPQLWNVVEEMSIAAGLTKLPDIYVFEDDGLNAFAVGRKPEQSAVAVTSGLLKRLNRDELQGVIGHEIGHIRNLDIRFMTLASVMVGSVVLLSDVFFRSLRYGTGRRTSRRGGKDGGAQAIFLLIALIVAILAPFAAQLLYFACSRQREYLADASSARFTRFPAGLAAALEKISHRASIDRATRATAPLFIINPLNAAGDEGLFSTHPPLEKRVAILRAMGGQAGFQAYEEAFHSVAGKTKYLIDPRTLASEGEVPAREASAPPEMPDPAEPGRHDQVERLQQVTDLLARMGNYLILPCVCGLKIKLPPEFRGDSIACPRCGREHRIPEAQLAAALATLPVDMRNAEQAIQAPEVLTYHRHVQGWESFKCACGQTQQLSPNFVAPRLTCKKMQPND